MIDPVDGAALAELAESIAVEAGVMLASGLHGQRDVATKSSDTDMVTEMDRASERLIVERLSAARPDDGLIGEEGAAHNGTSGVTWVIDPLDGTTNYLYRHPGWAVSIGAEVDGQPIAGSIVIPSTGDRFTASEGHGATWNGRPITIGSPAPLATALIGTGFNYDPAVRSAQATHVAGLIGEVRDIRRCGAAAVDLCSVASGRLDAYYEQGLGHWDHCAGTIIAREAGCRVELLTPIIGPGPLVVAAHPELFDDVVGLLRRVGAVA